MISKSAEMKKTHLTVTRFFSFSPLLFCFCLNTNMGGRRGDCFAFTCTAEQSLNTPQVVSSRQTVIWEPIHQAHISSQIHLPVILDVNNVTLTFPPPSPPPPFPLALLPRMSLCTAMTQV